MKETGVKENHPSPDGPGGDPQGDIAREHRALRETLTLLEESRDLNAVVAHLRTLLPHLESHFAKEESPTGLHQVIGDSAPHLLTRLQLIMGEHRQFVTSISSVIDRSERLIDGPIGEVLRDVREICRRLREHEATESELLGDSMYTDIGGKE